ncbi:thioredoxin domain-containing protein [Natronomonas salina]|uniref:thioredoxin domain-containing protein n=1 Tax=Natronomonas salina TaxID=1710540 RepID=UPI0015B586CE|nr:thioredoxin domain-containing protein [Natronomonas salina]QLD87565.1 thioredoxin domain-containing protein [Natronomonas salina]
MDNRLDEASSPYLRQHADNPVAWQPWDEEARELARERDVPIFLSIGYSACHWCHVMEEESFSDPEVAEVLNEHFVPIKVDREERPDVDSVYMTVCQLVRGQGGWPLSVWLTPDGRPFHVGTYFPPESKRGMPAFGDLLEDIAESWQRPQDREEMEHRADQWTDAVAGELEDTPDAPGDAPDAEFVDAAASAAVRGADREHGGWGRGQKFPQPGRLHLLLRAYDRTGREEYREVAVETLDAMAAGGLYDHVGGGFHRYCVDRDWTVPHFEKMLYDNAELPRAFLAGYQLTGDERYAEVSRETFAFVERELTHPDGGFYSTLDAQSEDEAGEREEGAFYVWTPGAVHDAVDDGTDADLFCDRYGVTEAGNFEDGQTVLTESASVEALADEYDLDAETVADRVERARQQVFEAREERPRPPRDEKVLAGWNGLMASAFAEGAITLDPEYGDVAAEAIDFAREYLWDEDERRLNRRFKDREVGIPGYLEDYAFLGRGALDTYQATGDVEHLVFAVELGRVIREAFYDEDEATLYFTPTGGESLVARPQEVTDASTPSSTGVAVQLLGALEHVAPEEGFGDVAETVVETHASKLESDPLSHAALALAADDLAVGALELTVAADGLPDEWRDALAETYVPSRFLTVRPPDEAGVEVWADELGLDGVPPIWADREALDGEPTVYACRSFTCSPPKHDMREALAWADSGR